MTAPDWLQLRDGALRPGLNGETWQVVIADRPEYKMIVRPAGGAFTCALTQTNNGKRLDAGVRYPTPDSALHGGLQELKAKLGW